MKYISLTQGQWAIVDDADFDLLNQWKWYARWALSNRSFYAERGVRVGKKVQKIQMHRLLLGLNHEDKRQCDHIHHNTLDNRRSQIRIVTHQQNQWNRKEAKGYHWKKNLSKYYAQIKVNGRVVYLGLYDNPQEARAAYINAKRAYHQT